MEDVRRRRILDALAKSIAERGYFATHVGNLVSLAHVARNTFYETFCGKDAAGHALLGEVSPDAAARVDGEKLEDSALGVLAVELAAFTYSGGSGSAGELRQAKEVIAAIKGFNPDSVERPASDDPTRCTLPPGRHGLSREFIAENQRARLLNAFAVTVAERGFFRVRVGDVTRAAAISRRTFYQHFENRDAAAKAFLCWCGCGQLLDLIAPTYGLGALAVEIVAVTLVGGKLAGEVRLRDAESLIAQLAPAEEAMAA